MGTERPAAVEVSNLAKHYGPVVALKNVDLTIETGEYFVLLGPSGGGKTTLLRTIGGFHKPTAGKVILHGRDVSELPPDKRPTSMVFQSYALFPHMTVAQNVGYGLTLTRQPRDEIRSRTEAMLDMVGLGGYGERRPHELSGGQQQRVQLARSLVLDRDILLLDEPLAALDAKLRKDMCLELKHLQEKVGITFVHVTHNQEEAMTIADRIALIADGELVEEGTARDIYEAPRKRFTADFVGENNILSGTVASVTEDVAQVDLEGGAIHVERGGLQVAQGERVWVSIRSELLRLGTGQEGHTLPATYKETVYLGLTTSHLVSLGDGAEVSVRLVSSSDVAPVAPGAEVEVSWAPGAARLHVS